MAVRFRGVKSSMIGTQLRLYGSFVNSIWLGTVCFQLISLMTLWHYLAPEQDLLAFELGRSQNGIIRTIRPLSSLLWWICRWLLPLWGDNCFPWSLWLDAWRWKRRYLRFKFGPAGNVAEQFAVSFSSARGIERNGVFTANNVWWWDNESRCTPRVFLLILLLCQLTIMRCRC